MWRTGAGCLFYMAALKLAELLIVDVCVTILEKKYYN